MMVGGHEESVQRLGPILDVLAPPDGWHRFGDAGAGHLWRWSTTAWRYGMMQAYAKGFELMHRSKFDIDLKDVTQSDQGSVRTARGCASSPSARSRRRATTSRA